MTSTLRRCRLSMTRPTDHSLPGMGCALITTTSFSRSLKNRFSPVASLVRADIGSPWEPVEITHTWPGSSWSTSSMSMRDCSGMSKSPSLRARATFFCMDRPRVATLGRSMQKNVALARKLGLLDIPEQSLIDIEDVDQLDPGQVCVISTGSQGEPMSALTKLATGENRFFKLRENDVVVISAHPIPGNEWSVGRVIDSLHRRNVEVIHSGVDSVHVSGHARQGELATLMSVTDPEFLIPVHGEYRHMANQVRVAESMGIAGDRVLLCEDGDAVRLDATGIHRDGTVPGGYLFVDGSSVGDIGHGVLRDRMVLAEEGVVMAVATVDLKRGEVVGVPQIVTRGWAYDHDTEALLDEARVQVTKALVQALASGSSDHENLNRVARKALGRLVGDRTRQRPMIVPVIVTV